MMTPDNQPILFLKAGCPHCLKVRLFLLEAELADTIHQRSFVPGDAEEAAIRAELVGRVDKMSFPAMRDTDDTYLTESDAIVARLAVRHGVDRNALPVFVAYADGVLPRYMAARRELASFKSA